MKLNVKRTILVGMAFLSICSFWQFYDNVIPLILTKTFNLGDTWTGVIMALDNILALFMLPLFGALSDKMKMPIGRRMPFILCGTLFSVALLLLLNVADRTRNFVMFIAVLLLLLIAMGTYRSPAVALMPDVTPPPLRSKGNAIINLMGTLGAVYTLVMIKLLVKTPAEGQLTNYLPLILSIVVIMVVAVAILFATIRENKLREEMERTCREAGVQVGEGAEDSESAGEGNGAGGKLPKEVFRSLVFILLSIFFWFTAYNAVTTAWSRYAENVWKLTDGGYANCLLVATLAAVVAYIPIGVISSKIGRKKTILGGVVMMTVCYLIAAFLPDYYSWLYIVFAVIGIGWAAINVNSYPMVVEMARAGDIGKYTGTYYTFSMAAQVFTPIFSGFLLEHVSYRTLFPYAVVFSVLAFITMTQVRHGDSKPAVKKSALENFDVDD
ncbi:MAG: MFS transporter [Lachnospiraceae bacterium]|nr:MFS transporter [Lachnospiraceae bacterium]